MAGNIRTTFDREFGRICDDLAAISAGIDRAIECSMQALVENDRAAAEDVIQGDERINQLRFKVEEACVQLIATQQPAASDLRKVIAAMHLAVEMERMGDYAAGIAKTVILMDEPLHKTIKKLEKMSELSRVMLGDSMKAFLNQDAAWAREIASRDDEIDALYQAIFERLVVIMARKPETIKGATYLMWCAHNLERIADRVTNIAERVIFMTTGDLRELKFD
jgi:phosphate transport system protein